MRSIFLSAAAFLAVAVPAFAQQSHWQIRDSTRWGIKNGIHIGIWPGAMEKMNESSDGGPRGLLRVGYDLGGMVCHINYIAIEPVVNGVMEFSEISPSASDGKWGKLMQAKTESVTADSLVFRIDMERFANGAHPYLRLIIRKSKPEEVCIEVNHHPGSTAMERCAVSATMGNYARLRKLYLKDTVISSLRLYNNFTGIDFIERSPYPAAGIRTDREGNPMVVAVTDESFTQMADWPQETAYWRRWSWRYRPYRLFSQYWRKDKTQTAIGLQVRVNGRAKYWTGGSRDEKHYIAIPGGPSFENFELREKYQAGQRQYFGISLQTPEALLSPL